jgi:hypothetical protein
MNKAKEVLEILVKPVKTQPPVKEEEDEEAMM